MAAVSSYTSRQKEIESGVRRFEMRSTLRLYYATNAEMRLLFKVDKVDGLATAKDVGRLLSETVPEYAGDSCTGAGLSSHRASGNALGKLDQVTHPRRQLSLVDNLEATEYNAK